MKILLSIMMLIATLSAASNWPNDYEAALREAKAENKSVYLFIGSEYCRFCERFENDVLSREDVIKTLKKKYVLIYLSREIDDIPIHLEQSPIPRHYFLTHKGEIIYTAIGYRSVEGFNEILDEVDEAIID